MSKTVAINDYVHIRLLEVQLDLKKIGIDIKMPVITESSILYGIDNVFEKLKTNNIAKEKVIV